MPPNGTGLTITNPLVLYRSLVATNRIAPDPGQHRLALHLQKLYERLIDYEPRVEFSYRLQQLSRAVDATQDVPPQPTSSSRTSTIGTRGIWASLLTQKEKRDSLALTRVLTSHEAAMKLQSPQGLMLHGEVGTGKSMLLDLFADCLPNRKKRRWHFNTFMLDTFSRLESLRKSRSTTVPESVQDEYSLLWLARDLIQTSPILFLDEFQLPDRAASKILSNLMTSFFQLGGVLIASSNRMPEELAKAAGMDFMRPVSRLSRLGWPLGLGQVAGRADGPGQMGEFAQFLEVLRARCEVWEMDGKKDYRRLAGEEDGAQMLTTKTISMAMSDVSSSQSAQSGSMITAEPDPAVDKESAVVPKYYLVQPSPKSDINSISSFSSAFDNHLRSITSTLTINSIPWTPSTLQVYGRQIPIPRHHAGIVSFTFQELCGATLGPADYISLASTYHTVILTDVPILTFLQKNEARRLITLLDALYEAKCRLMVTAAAGPDDVFFPEPKTPPGEQSQDRDSATDILTTDAVHPETYSEIHQDLTSPFRPNISSYALADDALEDDPPNRFRRPGSSFTDERRSGSGSGQRAPDFANIGGLTGEDERFAVKRARSRMWELCSARWWARGEAGAGAGAGAEGEHGWWRPVPPASRHWEKSAPVEPGASDSTVPEPDTEAPDVLPPDGASPFRTVSDPPPSISWTHVWGTVKWGKRAGAWGKGVEGLEERRRKERNDDGARGQK